MVLTPPQPNLPLPDSAVGKHEAVKVSVHSYWIRNIHIPGHVGKYDCLVTASPYMRCHLRKIK